MTPKKCQDKYEREKPNYVYNIEGLGKVEVYGEWDKEEFIRSLLKCKFITG